MSPRVRILLVTADLALAGQVQTRLDAIEGVRLETAQSEEEAIAWALRSPPSLIAACQESGRINALDFHRSLQAHPGLASLPFLLIIDSEDTAIEQAGLAAGIHEVISREVAPTSLETRLRLMGQLRRTEDQLRRASLETGLLQERLRQGNTRLVCLLTGLAEAALPGARARGEWRAQNARRIALRLEVPGSQIVDLEIAARLQEIGRLIAPCQDLGSEAGLTTPDTWQEALAASAVFRQTEEFKGAGDVLNGIYENWDGSGLPQRLLRTEIPIISRILRVLVDYQVRLASSRTGDWLECMEELSTHAGVRYDPAVLAHLKTLLENDADSSSRGQKLVVPVTQLQQGMVLAEDLFTESGIKLLARDTTLTDAILKTILQRHRFDPILHGAVVYRAPAGSPRAG